MRLQKTLLLLSSVLLLFFAATGCGKPDAVADDGSSRSRAKDGDAKRGDAKKGDAKKGDAKKGETSARRPGGGGWGGGGEEPRAAVPVEVAVVERRGISSYLETNGTLESELDVELLARAAGPIVELLVEEGLTVEKGQLLARIDPQELRARLEITRVSLEEARINFERAQRLYEDELLSQEAFEEARSTYETLKAQLQGDEVVLGYTRVEAPFDGVISERFIKLAQTVRANDPLFRITAFDPLLCPIQVPERELTRLAVGQEAFLEVEAWPEERFPARLLRISPIVNSATGTVKVTLEAGSRGKLRPGMFASVFLETERRSDALVIPKAALSLESIGDTVYVVSNVENGEAKAERREVRLGFQEGDGVQVVEGLEAGERVVVVGQDGLSDGTPIQVLGRPGGA